MNTERYVRELKQVFVHWEENKGWNQPQREKCCNRGVGRDWDSAGNERASPPPTLTPQPHKKQK